MSSKRRRAALPPWLQGVTVKKKAANAQKDTVVLDKEEERDVKAGTNSNLNTDKADGVTLDAQGHIPDKGNFKKLEEKKSDTNEEEWTVEKAVEMSYKEFIFKGSIIYSHNMDDCNLLCDDILSDLDENTETVIGFDTEWPVTYEKGKQGKTALIQLCLSADKCYLFHVSCMPKFPVMLKKLIQNHHLKKVGLNIENDFWKLDTDFDINALDVIKNSAVELKTLGNKKLRSAENWSLEGLTKNVLRMRISKDPSVRKCDWRQFPLPEAQQRYAATDAVISLLLYQTLIAK